MKFLDDTGHEYFVRFTHVKPGKGQAPIGTVCAVTQASSQKIGVGHTLCSKRDQFVRLTGRKIAFGRALMALGVDKPTRTALWRRFLIHAQIMKS